MRYVYHMRPKEMVGRTLYPLNDLKAQAPDRYERERAKYLDHPERRKLPERVVPKLDCSWGDVVHFAPVHPHLVFRAWRDLGEVLPGLLWFRVPVERLAKLPAVVYRPPQARRAGGELRDEDVGWLDACAYRELAALPGRTLAWYAGLHERGLKGAWFAHVPHVLVRGAVDVDGVELVDWAEAV